MYLATDIISYKFKIYVGFFNFTNQKKGMPYNWVNMVLVYYETDFVL